MQVGLLWFDDDPKRDVREKVAQAARRYREKFGHPPTLCYVHPAAMTKAEMRCHGIKVVAAPNILPHHFWLGVGKDGRTGRRGKNNG